MVQCRDQSRERPQQTHLCACQEPLRRAWPGVRAAPRLGLATRSSNEVARRSGPRPLASTRPTGNPVETKHRQPPTARMTLAYACVQPEHPKSTLRHAHGRLQASTQDTPGTTRRHAHHEREDRTPPTPTDNYRNSARSRSSIHQAQPRLAAATPLTPRPRTPPPHDPLRHAHAAGRPATPLRASSPDPTERRSRASPPTLHRPGSATGSPPRTAHRP